MDGLGEMAPQARVGPNAFIRRPLVGLIVLALSALRVGGVSARQETLRNCVAALEDLTSVAPSERLVCLRDRHSAVAPLRCHTADLIGCSDWL